MSLKNPGRRVNTGLIIGAIIALIVLYFLTIGRGIFGASADILTPAANNTTIDKAKLALYKEIFTTSIDNAVNEIDANQAVSFHVEAYPNPSDSVSTSAQELAKSLQVTNVDDFGKFKVKMAKDIFGTTYKANDIRLESVTRLWGGTGDSLSAQLSGPVIGAADSTTPGKFSADYSSRTPNKVGKGTIKSNTYIHITITDGTTVIRDVKLTEAIDTDTWIDPDLSITSAPTVVSVTPAQAKVSDKVTLVGTSFLQTAANTIKFVKDGEAAAQIPNIAATIEDKTTPNVRTLKFAVPQLAVGTYNVVVNTRNGDSTQSRPLEVIVEKPTITNLTIDGVAATEGAIGQLLTIKGLKFGSRNDIYLDDRQVAKNAPSTNNGTSLVVEIPDVAAKAYKVTVRSGNQTSNAVDFTVKAASTDVTITSFATTTAQDITEIKAGTDLIISGTNFGSSNAVLFNGKVVAAGLNSSDGKSIQFRVPKSQKVQSYQVKVKNGTKESDAKTLSVLKAGK
jgi:hypothetical protein